MRFLRRSVACTVGPDAGGGMGGISSGEAVEEPPTAPNACVSPDKDQNRTGSFRSAMRASGEPRLKRNDSKVQFEVEETPPTTYPSPRPKGKKYNPSLFKRSSSSKCAGDCSNLACTARAQSHDISLTNLNGDEAQPVTDTLATPNPWSQ